MRVRRVWASFTPALWQDRGRFAMVQSALPRRKSQQFGTLSELSPLHCVEWGETKGPGEPIESTKTVIPLTLAVSDAKLKTIPGWGARTNPVNLESGCSMANESGMNRRHFLKHVAGASL